MTEAEYIAASEDANKVVWIRNFVSELGVILSASSPMGLYCDNNGAIVQAKEPRTHKRPNMYYDIIISSAKSLVEVM
jgi:hypothetical protein